MDDWTITTGDSSNPQWTITTTTGETLPNWFFYDKYSMTARVLVLKCPCGCERVATKTTSFHQWGIGTIKITYKKCPNENGIFHKDIESIEIDGKIFNE